MRGSALVTKLPDGPPGALCRGKEKKKKESYFTAELFWTKSEIAPSAGHVIQDITTASEDFRRFKKTIS